MRRRGGLALAVLLALALAVGVGGDEVDAGISSGTRNGDGAGTDAPTGGADVNDGATHISGAASPRTITSRTSTRTRSRTTTL